MNTIDYDKALYFTLWGQWDELLVLMVRTRDDLLSKKIEHFLHAFHFSKSEENLIDTHEALLHYIDHAQFKESDVYYKI